MNARELAVSKGRSDIVQTIDKVFIEKCLLYRCSLFTRVSRRASPIVIDWNLISTEHVNRRRKNHSI